MLLTGDIAGKDIAGNKNVEQFVYVRNYNTTEQSARDVRYLLLSLLCRHKG